MKEVQDYNSYISHSKNSKDAVPNSHKFFPGLRHPKFSILQFPGRHMSWVKEVRCITLRDCARRDFGSSSGSPTVPPQSIVYFFLFRQISFVNMQTARVFGVKPSTGRVSRF